jgi:hypothetical protein
VEKSLPVDSDSICAGLGKISTALPSANKPKWDEAE